MSYPKRSGLSRNDNQLRPIYHELGSNTIDGLTLEMTYALCDELQSAQSLNFQPLFHGMVYTCPFRILDLIARVEHALHICGTMYVVFSVTYNICEGPQLDARRSQSIMFANCWYDTILQHK